MENLISFREYLAEGGGQDAGKLELVKTSLDKAIAWADKEFRKNGKSLEEEMPKFDSRYLAAQKKASLGKTQRKDMPVIQDSDVRHMQLALKNGMIDIKGPWNPETNQKNPFPEGLSGKAADSFLKGGLKIKDGSAPDDKVNVKKGKVAVGKLKPIQKQIYFDKSMGSIAQFGVEGSTKFIGTSTFILSADNFIIDGHHRWLSGLLLDPSMSVNGLIIDLPIKKLLPLSLAFGDAIGNKRNK